MEEYVEHESHVDRHKKLHRYFDELLADWIDKCESRPMPSKNTVLDLMVWSNKQTSKPDHDE